MCPCATLLLIPTTSRKNIPPLVLGNTNLLYVTIVSCRLTLPDLDFHKSGITNLTISNTFTSQKLIFVQLKSQKADLWLSDCGGREKWEGL